MSDDRFLNAGYKRWFAWYPMKTERGWAWLRHIERKSVPFGWYVRELRLIGFFANLTPEQQKAALNNRDVDV